MTGYVVFPPSFIAELREKVDLAALIAEDITLRQTGGRFVGICPFHDDRSPSFQVDPGQGFYKCWGCQATGDAIQWLRDREGVSFNEAVTRLASRTGMTIPEATSEGDELRNERKALAPLYRALASAQRLYEGGLAKRDRAKAYLSSRQITDETRALFGLGAVGRGVIEFLRDASEETLIAAGLAGRGAQGEIYDRFRHRLMLPIHTEAGNLVGFGGRRVDHREGQPKYINSPEGPLFRKGELLYGLHLAKREIRRSRSAIVVEGYFDVIVLHQAGEARAVASMGTALTMTQLQRLMHLADEITFLFDGDKAGQRAAMDAADSFLSVMRDGKSAKFVFLPADHDPDSFVRDEGLAALHARMERAHPLSTVYRRWISRDLDLSLPEHRVKAAALALGAVARIKHAPLYARALRSHFEQLVGMELCEETA